MTLSLPFDVNVERDRAMDQVAAHAEVHRPGFAELAAQFVVAYLHQHGPSSGEVITEACKAAGIKPHDDRAFGPIYYRLSKQNRIVKVGTCRRERGHRTAGGNIWGLR